MPTRQKIIEFVQAHAPVSSTQLMAHLALTRQAINLQLRQLILDEKIVKTGSTRAALYYPATAKLDTRAYSKDLTLRGLKESEIYAQIALLLNLSRLKPNVEAILHYAFTEMLNNAIDHSHAEQCRVAFKLNATIASFEINDPGIGVFESISNKFDLPNQHAAMIELVKGKTTTMPDAHAGEGYFFTARAADRLVLRSHRIQLEWNRRLDDVFASETRFKRGTSVKFEIDTHSRTKLERVFNQYAPADYDFQFQRTHVRVKLLQSDYFSRSEAKRLLNNLDKFSEVELDMKRVNNVGQGFADQVFRVFAAQHPQVKIRATHANDAVAAMIKHVQSL